MGARWWFIWIVARWIPVMAAAVRPGACVALVCPGTDVSGVTAVGEAIGVDFEYVYECMTGGTRRACIVFSDMNSSAMSDGGRGFRACTDANYVRLTDDTRVLRQDIARVFGALVDGMTLCDWHGDDEVNVSRYRDDVTWCMFAAWQGEDGGCDPAVRLRRDTFDDASVATCIACLCTAFAVLLACCFIGDQFGFGATGDVGDVAVGLKM